jgi:hypothetical protein
VDALMRAMSSMPTEAVEPATVGTPSRAHARGRPLLGVLEIPMRTVWRLLVLSLALVGCSAAATPSTGPTLSATVVVAASASPSASQVASRSARTIVSPLEGRWATGLIPIADIKASMLAAGIEAGDVDGWIAEVGSPTEYSFLLEFAGTAFTHSEETPDMAMQVGELGTFTLSGRQLVLTPGEPGNIDTYTFEVTLAGDELSLRCVDSTEQGTTEDKAKHRRYTIAFYCSAPFRRQPGTSSLPPNDLPAIG